MNLQIMYTNEPKSCVMYIERVYNSCEQIVCTDHIYSSRVQIMCSIVYSSYLQMIHTDFYVPMLSTEYLYRPCVQITFTNQSCCNLWQKILNQMHAVAVATYRRDGVFNETLSQHIIN